MAGARHASSAEIAALVANIDSANKAFGSAAGRELNDARRKLHAQAKQLVNALDDPDEEVWPRIYQVNVSTAIEVVSQMGLWNNFEGGKTLSRAEIVTVTGADEIMIIRIFRQLVAAGIVAEIPGPRYALTKTGQPYLDANHRAFNNFILNDIIPVVMAMPRTMAERGYKAPSKESGTPFAWAHGEELWTWLGSHPKNAAMMVAGMKSFSVAKANAYPWGEVLADFNLKDDDVAIVDIAGGQGHDMEEVLMRYPNIKGRIIVQDLPSTFEAVSKPPLGIEFMPHDMFKPQPINKACIYHFRHIIHDWNDKDCGIILQQIVPLLKQQPKSKLLLVDLILPDSEVPMQESIRDLTLFAIGGMERNETQWRDLLAKNGLKIMKIWRGIELEACVECALA